MVSPWLDNHYIVAQILATAIRIFHSLTNSWRRYKIGGYTTDWERAWGCWSREYTIPSSVSPRMIRIRVWEPPPSSSLPSSPPPVHINFHGSGHVIRGTFGSDSDYCEYLATKLGIVVLDCDYAKGPEYPYPHGSTDAHDIVKHVISAYGTTYDLSNLTVGGFSAGGGLAVGLATSDDEIVEKSIKAVVGVYPWIDISFTLHTPSKEASSVRPVPWPLRAFALSYVHPPTEASDPRVSPALLSDAELVAAFKEGNPKSVCFVVAENDSITPQVEHFAKRLARLGIRVSYNEIRDVGHAWDKSHPPGNWEADRKEEAYAFIADFLSDVYGS